MTRLRDYFLMSSALRDAALSDADKNALRAQLRLAEQRRGAAETLWSTGHSAEALRLARDGFAEGWKSFEHIARSLPTAAALAPAAEPALDEDALDESAPDASVPDASEPNDVAPAAPSPVERALVAAGFSRRERAQLSLARAASSEAMPSTDDAVSSTHAKSYRAMRRSTATLIRKIDAAIVTPRQRTLRRLGRASLLVAAAALLVVGGYFLLREPTFVHATSSGNFGPEYPPDHAIDGAEESEWVLPERRAAWLELHLSPARNLSALRILNGHNAPYNDRSARRYRVELKNRSGETIEELTGEFEEFSEAPEWVTHETDASGVAYIRLHVTRWHRRGGSIAELAFDER